MKAEYVLSWKNSEQHHEWGPLRFATLREARERVRLLDCPMGDFGRPYSLTWKIERVQLADTGTVHTKATEAS